MYINLLSYRITGYFYCCGFLRIYRQTDCFQFLRIQKCVKIKSISGITISFVEHYRYNVHSKDLVHQKRVRNIREMDQIYLDK